MFNYWIKKLKFSNSAEKKPKNIFILERPFDVNIKKNNHAIQWYTHLRKLLKEIGHFRRVITLLVGRPQVESLKMLKLFIYVS